VAQLHWKPEQPKRHGTGFPSWTNSNDRLPVPQTGSPVSGLRCIDLAGQSLGTWSNTQGMCFTRLHESNWQYWRHANEPMHSTKTGTETRTCQAATGNTASWGNWDTSKCVSRQHARIRVLEPLRHKPNRAACMHSPLVGSATVPVSPMATLHHGDPPIPAVCAAKRPRRCLFRPLDQFQCKLSE